LAIANQKGVLHMATKAQIYVLMLLYPYTLILLFLLPLPREIAERYLSGVRPESDELRIPTYERIRLFMQNKANFQKSQINVTKLLTKDYKNKTLSRRAENKPNSKPIKPNLLNAQMNVNKVSTKDYENISNWAIYENKANSNPIQTQSNPIYRGVASSEDGTCRGVASGEDGSEVKNAATRPYCRRRTLAYYTRIRGYFPDDDDLLRKT